VLLEIITVCDVNTISLTSVTFRVIVCVH